MDGWMDGWPELTHSLTCTIALLLVPDKVLGLASTPQITWLGHGFINVTSSPPLKNP